jgi:hypothetical protein
MLIDAYKRKVPYYWFLIIFFVPFGAFIYFVVMKLPHLKEESGATNPKNVIKPPVFKESIRQLRDNFEKIKTRENQQKLADALAAKGLFGEAMAEYSSILQTHKEDMDALFGSGYCALKTGQNRKAIDIFLQITKMRTSFKNYEAWSLLAEAYWLNGEKQKSVETLRHLYKINPKIKHQLVLAKCHLEMKDIKSAKRALLLAIEDFKKSRSDIQEREKADYNKARRMLKKIIHA